LNNLAILYQQMGRYNDAEPLYQKSLTIREQQLGKNHPDVADSLHNLAYLYQEMDRYNEAEPLYQKALNIWQNQLGENHPNVATSLNNLGILYQEMRRYREAEPLLKISLAIREKQLGINHPDLAESFNNLALLYQSMGRYSDAESLLTQSLKIWQTQLGATHPYMAINLDNLAALYAVQGKLKEGINFLNQGLEVEETNILRNVVTLTEREQQAYLQTLKYSENGIISLHLQQLPQDSQASRVALTTILRRKGRILDTLSHRLQRLRADASPADQQQLQQLSQLYTQLTNLYNQGAGNLSLEAYRQQVQTLENQIEQQQKQLAQNLPELSPQPVTLTAIQALIPKDAVLIEFFRYEPFDPKAPTLPLKQRFGKPHYAVYLLHAQGDPIGLDLGEAAGIDQRLGLFRQQLTDPSSTTQLSTIAQQLYQTLMQPLTPYLGSATHLLISPDSHLNLIPFAALQNPQGQYLLDYYNITVLSSGRDLLRYQKHYTTQQPPVIIAHPNYNGSSDPQATQLIAQANRGITQVSISTDQTPLPASSVAQVRSVGVPFPWSDLPGTEQEGRLIAPKLANALVLQGNQATEAVVKALHSPKVLHLATHGFFLPSSNKDQNPLVGSGLILAGANLQDSSRNNGEDGVLTALEVSGLDLRGTQLVVMSACDTGRGDVANGEGVYGLRRALTLSGAESQLFSLWEVNDWATQALLTRYYDYLLKGQGRSEAWRQTQLDMLHGRLNSMMDSKGLATITNVAHPNYWAAFVPSGNWLPL
jgi:CHAT domain-containing protein